MSVLIEGISIVVRIETIKEKYRGGLEQYLADCPTRFCLDDHLVAVMFQMPDDVFRWIRRLEVHGLVYIKMGSFSDIAAVDRLNGLTGKCNWLNFYKIRIKTIDCEVNGKISCCRLKGTRGDRIELPAFPPGWTYSNALNNQTRYVPLNETYERLHFLEHKDGVDDYHDTQKGDKVNIERPFGGGNELMMSVDFFDKGIELVQPYLPLILENMAPKDPASDKGLRDMEKGIGYLKEAVRLHPHNAWARWYTGKAYQALWDYERAYEHFQAAYNLQPEESTFCGTLMEACWYLRKTGEAISVARAALRMWPKDPAWISDYGYSLMKDGQLQKAKRILKKALRMDPTDAHTQKGLKMIAEIEPEA